MENLKKEDIRLIRKLLNQSLAGLNVDKSFQALNELKTFMTRLDFESKDYLLSDIECFITTLRWIDNDKKDFQNKARKAK